jgi:hypothetical protein
MMYHEVHHSKRQGCSIRKISEELALNFRTVRKYLSMSEEEFFKHLEVQSHRYKKLILYEEFVKERLGRYPETKSAQMHDWLNIQQKVKEIKKLPDSESYLLSFSPQRQLLDFSEDLFVLHFEPIFS